MNAPRPLRLVLLDADTLDGHGVDLAPLERFGRLVRHPTTPRDETPARAAEADILLTNKVVVDETVLAAAPDLRLVVVTATGTDNIDLEAARRHGVAVCNVRGYSTPSVAQHTLTLLLLLATNAHRYDAERDRWPDSPIFTRLDHPVVELAGRTLGIAGLGTIGSAVARLAAAHGMHVQALAREGADHHPATGIPRVPRETFFRTSDAVSLHCPLTRESERMIDPQTLAWMPAHAFLVNTSRGGLVDEPALAAALRERAIAGAALDVLSKEPPPADHPLLAPDLPNLVLTPHTAWLARESRRRLIDGVAAAIAGFLEGTPPNQVA